MGTAVDRSGHRAPRTTSIVQRSTSTVKANHTIQQAQAKKSSRNVTLIGASRKPCSSGKVGMWCGSGQPT